MLVFGEKMTSMQPGCPREENLWARALRLIAGEKHEIFDSFWVSFECLDVLLNKKQPISRKTWHKKCHREAPMAEKVGVQQQCIIASKGKRWYNRM